MDGQLGCRPQEPQEQQQCITHKVFATASSRAQEKIYQHSDEFNTYHS